MSKTDVAQKISLFLLGLSGVVIAFILFVGMCLMLGSRGFSTDVTDWFNRSKWVLGFAVFVAVSNFLIAFNLEPVNDD